MAQNLTYKCPTCGAEIFWNAQEGKFACEYCGDKFTLEDMRKSGQTGEIDEENVQKHEELEEGEYAESSDGTVGKDLVKYTCSHCGAEIITDRATAATICVYCGNAVIMSEQIVKDFRPEYVIPFRVRKEIVMETFKKFSKKPLTPKDFDCERVVDKMQGVYIPFWLYTGSCHGELVAKGINKRRVGDNKTEKTYYNVYREGTLGFECVPVDASSKTDNDAMDSIEPFNYKELKPFDPSYLSGFLAERFDEDKEKCRSRAVLRMENTTKDALKATCSYDELDVKDYQKQVKITKTTYALFPTWLLYTTYKNEKFFFAMNGQTAKFIGNLPIDKVKLIIYSILGGVGGSVIGAILGAIGVFS